MKEGRKEVKEEGRARDERRQRAGGMKGGIAWFVISSAVKMSPKEPSRGV